MYIKDVRGQLLNAFNAETGLSLTLEDVDFVNPGVWLQAGCNAKVVVKAKDSSNYAKNSVELLYNRWLIADALGMLTLPGSAIDYPNTLDVIRYLREVLNVSAYDGDFYHTDIDPTATEAILTPRVDALVWLPPHPVTFRFE